MLKKLFSLALVVIWISGFICIEPAHSAPATVEYLCELGIQFYRQGRYDDALTEFKKALSLDSSNKTALRYINDIFSASSEPAQQLEAVPAQFKADKYDAMEQALNNYKEAPKAQAKPAAPVVKPAAKDEAVDEALEIAGVKVTGEAQIRVGMDSGDAVWKRANWDLNERNYRRNSDSAFDNKENTYDPRIYDRMAVKLEKGNNEEGLSFYSNVVVDPWSFTGKSAKTTVSSAFGDTAEVELKYWSNTGYTINEKAYTTSLGNSFNLPEIKVKDGRTDAFTKAGDYTIPVSDSFTIPATKIYYQFQPVRELWAGYNSDIFSAKFYPLAYENQASTFDDPLRLSNNRQWWEDSPWIRRWTPGRRNSGLTPVDFTRGYWDNTLSFYTRDSEGQRLTGLRGLDLQLTPWEGTSIVSNFATPKDLWQDYSDADNIISATRLKHRIWDSLNIGATYTARLGFETEKEYRTDAKNYVAGGDINYEPINGIMASAEVAASKSYYDLSDDQFKSEKGGNAYYFSLIGRFPFASVINTKYGYDGIQPDEKDRFFNKFRFFVSRMDESFDQSLSSYVETRDDEWWGRHLNFRQPFRFFYEGDQGEGKLLTWDDVKNRKVGNGIDIGRNTIGLRIESQLWDKQVDNLFDVRNVHGTNGKFIENVVRDELTWQANEKLTTKMLGIYNKLPRTTAGLDPFLFDPLTRQYYANSEITDGLDPTLKTGSLGLEYALNDWMTVNGIWEYTNDYTLGYDGFPRSILSSTDMGSTFSEYDNQYRQERAFLYSQQFFPKPPYDFYNIFRTGLTLTPSEKWQFYLDYTRNSYEKAGQVDGNLNHIGLEVSYSPTPKLGIFFKYIYSRWQDLDKLIAGSTKLYSHHNAFIELMYRKSELENFVFQYGEASRNPYEGGLLNVGWDPYGSSVETLDTEHIFRLYYRRKF
ncbi:MAG: tetratricopeptide repeat protein [Candidatus Omnitrophota bacterium]